MAKEKKKGFVLRALDTVEHVGNALPNPATIFLILTGVVIVLSAICAACVSLYNRTHQKAAKLCRQ